AGVYSGFGPSSNVRQTSRLVAGPLVRKTRRGSAVASRRRSSCRQNEAPGPDPSADRHPIVTLSQRTLGTALTAGKAVTLIRRLSARISSSTASAASDWLLG